MRTSTKALRTLGLLAFWLQPAFASAAPRPKNVLFIAVDDLRPEIGAYGVKLAKTPHMDALAKRSMLFTRAYVSQAVCSPSRTVLMTGRRPDTTKVYDLLTHFRLNLPDVVTLPQYFKQHGYHTQAYGKLYHSGLDDPASWSVLPKGAKTGIPQKLTPPQTKAGSRGPAWESVEADDSSLADGQTADKAIETLKKLKGKPFFLGVGFVKPHLPFIAPRKYYDLFKDVALPMPRNPYPPKDAPPMAATGFGELRYYRDVPSKGPIDQKMTGELIRGYYAAVSYTDALIGRVLAALDELGLRDDTIVVLWGDHGWKLGEHGAWCKHTNYEIDTRTTLMVNAPGVGTPGSKTDALVETVDLYPTLVELAGLPPSEGLEGASFAPLLADPKRPWKKAAFSQYPRGPNMGYAMKTDRYRFVEWLDPAKKRLAVELYDHQKDPDENTNVAGKAENAALVAELSKQLAAGWRAAGPPARK